MSIFTFDDYKRILRVMTEQRRAQFGNRVTFEKVAKACGVQKTYLSRVLNGKGHLSADQLYSACEFLRLSEAETDYVILLREHALTDHPRRKTRLNGDLQRIRDRQLKIETVIEDLGKPAKSHQTWEYYADTDLLLVHMLLTVPRFAKWPSEIGNTLSLPQSRVQQILTTLQKWGLVRFKNDKYELDQPMQHLPKNSPIFRTHASALRQRTIDRIRQDKDDADYIFSTVFSAEAAFQTRFIKSLLHLLKATQAEVVKADAEEVYQLNIDFFKWT